MPFNDNMSSSDIAGIMSPLNSRRKGSCERLKRMTERVETYRPADCPVVRTATRWRGGRDRTSRPPDGLQSPGESLASRCAGRAMPRARDSSRARASPECRQIHRRRRRPATTFERPRAARRPRFLPRRAIPERARTRDRSAPHPRSATTCGSAASCRPWSSADTPGAAG